MKNEHKTQMELLSELSELRLKLHEMEALQAEKRQAEELYRTMAESSYASVYILQEGAFQFVNPRFVEDTGYNEKEMLGMASVTLIHPEDRKHARENAIKMLRGERKIPYEFRLIAKDGRVRWILETVNSIHYRGKRAVLGNSMDITVQKEARDKVEQLQALESSILDALPIAVMGMRERRILFANRAAESVFGWKPEELVGQSTKVLYRSDAEYEEIGRHFYAVLEKQRTHSEEFPCRHKDGRDIICLVSTSRVGESLQEKGIVATYEDITERKRAEDALKASEDKLKEILERFWKQQH